LLVQSVLIGNAGFAVVLLEVAAVAVRPSLLVEVHVPDAANGGLAFSVILLRIRRVTRLAGLLPPTLRLIHHPIE
jgi:hypothetical protein